MGCRYPGPTRRKPLREGQAAGLCRSAGLTATNPRTGRRSTIDHRGEVGAEFGFMRTEFPHRRGAERGADHDYGCTAGLGRTGTGADRSSTMCAQAQPRPAGPGRGEAVASARSGWTAGQVVQLGPYPWKRPAVRGTGPPLVVGALGDDRVPAKVSTGSRRDVFFRGRPWP